MNRQSRQALLYLGGLCAVLLLLMIPQGRAFAQEEVGTFLAVPVDVVGEGMGGTDVARWGGGISPFSNPAAAVVRRPSAALTHGLLLADQNLSALSVRLPIQGGNGGLALMGRLVNHASIPRFDQGGARLGSLSPQDMSLGLAYGIRWKGLSLGTAAHYVQENLEIAKGTGFAYDLGGMLQLGWVRLGAAGTNLLGTLDYDGESYDLPQKFSAGLALAPRGREIEFAASYSNWRYGDEEFSFGLQWSLFQNILTLRGGYVSTVDSSDDENFSPYRFGFSVGHSGLALDYAYLPHEQLGQVHFLALRWAGR